MRFKGVEREADEVLGIARNFLEIQQIKQQFSS